MFSFSIFSLVNPVYISFFYDPDIYTEKVIEGFTGSAE